ncbi:MAG: hypothetical protein ACK56Y_04830 [Pseudanabaena sp.]
MNSFTSYSLPTQGLAVRRAANPWVFIPILESVATLLGIKNQTQ